MAKPTRVKDLYVQNGWYLEFPGLISPHFETLEGLARTSNSVEIVDGGTNKKHKFGSQILDFSDMTLTRTMQGTVEDKTLHAIADDMILRGLRLPVIAVKLHHQQEVFRILFEEFKINSQNLPNFDVNSEDKFTISYSASCSDWDILWAV
jgi:hypothetical protein